MGFVYVNLVLAENGISTMDILHVEHWRNTAARSGASAVVFIIN